MNNSEHLPLVVDLDGTLIRTDLLVESASQYISKNLLRIFVIFYYLLKGRSQLKHFLAERVRLDAGALPYNTELLSWLKQQKESGRLVVLATASSEIYAEKISKYLGLFDVVYGSTMELNLKSHQKKSLLVSRYGDFGFEYVGNEDADLPIWSVSAGCYMVGGSKGLEEKVRSFNNLRLNFDSKPKNSFKNFLKAMRLHQWLKNTLIFVPLLAAHQYKNTELVGHSIIAFITFGLTASSAYVLNDLIDLIDDRYHKSKRRRPFASGDVSLIYGWMLWPSLLVLAFGLSVLFLPTAYVLIQIAYLLTTLGYSFYLKRMPIIDASTLSILYTLRIVAGTVATGVAFSFWLLTFSMFIFFSLAMVKRASELIPLYGAALEEKSKNIRGRGYQVGDMMIVKCIGVASSLISVLVLALYIQDAHSLRMYRSPEIIWICCPLLLYWVSRVWLITSRGGMHDDPVVFAAKDSISWIIFCVFIAAMMLAK